MKKTLLFLIVILFSGYVQAQDQFPKHVLRTGLSRAFFTSGDFGGWSVYGEYTYNLNPYLGLTPRILSGNAVRTSDMYSEQYHRSTFVSSLALTVTPLPKAFRWVKFDIGLAYGTNTYLNAQEISFTHYYVERDFGVCSSLKVNFIDNANFEFGTRMDMVTALVMNGLEARAWHFGLYFGKKF
jgi:hypothetical protein